MKDLTIGQKIAGGFAALIIISAIVGGIASLTMSRVRGDAEQMSREFVAEANIGGLIQETVARTQLATRSYGFTADEKYIKDVKAGLTELDRQSAEAHALANKFSDLVKLREHLANFDTALKDYKAAVDETEAKNAVIVTGREQLNTASAAFITNIDKIIKGQNERLDQEVKEFAGTEKLIERHQKITLANEIRGLGNAARIAVFKAQAMRTPGIIAEGVKNFEEMNKCFDELKSMLKVQADLEELGLVRKAADAYQMEMVAIMGSLTALDEIGKKRAEAGGRLDTHANDIAEAGMKRTVTAADESSVMLGSASTSVQILLGVAIVLGVAVAFFIIRGTTRVLRAATDSLILGSEQIVAAAGQVSSSSQSLAEGASEQAASLEETSSSIEELNSMTRNNAQNADQAKSIAQTARHSADQSATAVTKLNTAMSELKVSNSEVAKIVKSIDEIAFQTNILALNAAVEAARAGEAGAGFAVVAEEVRNLAQRSAQAAKETADKIDNALAKSEDGARISDEVSTSLSGIIEQVRKLDSLVTEIATASKEQSQGIGQVNDAVVQIDKVTQSNAAGAEECASASEELNAQAAELNNLVGSLLTLVGGRRGTDAEGRMGAAQPNGVRHTDHSGHPKTPSPRPAVAAPAKSPKVTSPKPAANGKHPVEHAGTKSGGEMDRFFS